MPEGDQGGGRTATRPVFDIVFKFGHIEVGRQQDLTGFSRNAVRRFRQAKLRSLQPAALGNQTGENPAPSWMPAGHKGAEQLHIPRPGGGQDQSMTGSHLLAPCLFRPVDKPASPEKRSNR